MHAASMKSCNFLGLRSASDVVLFATRQMSTFARARSSFPRQRRTLEQPAITKGAGLKFKVL
jgi:hypothetical protein